MIPLPPPALPGGLLARAAACSTARPGAALLAAALGCAALALLPGEAGPLAARAGLAALAIGAVAVLWRRRPGRAGGPALRVIAQAGVGRTGAVAIVEVDGRRFLLGAAERSIELLAELSPAGPEVAP